MLTAGDDLGHLRRSICFAHQRTLSRRGQSITAFIWAPHSLGLMSGTLYRPGADPQIIADIAEVRTSTGWIPTYALRPSGRQQPLPPFDEIAKPRVASPVGHARVTARLRFLACFGREVALRFTIEGHRAVEVVEDDGAGPVDIDAAVDYCAYLRARRGEIGLREAGLVPGGRIDGAFEKLMVYAGFSVDQRGAAGLPSVPGELIELATVANVAAGQPYDSHKVPIQLFAPPFIVTAGRIVLVDTNDGTLGLTQLRVEKPGESRWISWLPVPGLQEGMDVLRRLTPRVSAWWLDEGGLELAV